MPQGVSTMKNNTGTFGPYFLFLCAFFMMVFSVLSALGWLAIGGSLALLILTAFLNPDFRKPEDPNNPVSTWLILAFCIFWSVLGLYPHAAEREHSPRYQCCPSTGADRRDGVGIY